MSSSAKPSTAFHAAANRAVGSRSLRASRTCRRALRSGVLSGMPAAAVKLDGARATQSCCTCPRVTAASKRAHRGVLPQGRSRPRVRPDGRAIVVDVDELYDSAGRRELHVSAIRETVPQWVGGSEFEYPVGDDGNPRPPWQAKVLREARGNAVVLRREALVDGLSLAIVRLRDFAP